MQAMRIEPAYCSVDALHHICHVCEYMKTTFRRLQFVFKLIWPKKTEKKMARASRFYIKQHFFLIEKTILYLLTVRK